MPYSIPEGVTSPAVWAFFFVQACGGSCRGLHDRSRNISGRTSLILCSPRCILAEKTNFWHVTQTPSGEHRKSMWFLFLHFLVCVWGWGLFDVLIIYPWRSLLCELSSGRFPCRRRWCWYSARAHQSQELQQKEHKKYLRMLEIVTQNARSRVPEAASLRTYT